LAVIGSGVYLYKNSGLLIEEAREKISNAAVEALSDALPGLIDAAMPTIPEVTGPAVSSPTFSGPPINLP